VRRYYWIIAGLGFLVAACDGHKDQVKAPGVAGAPVGYDANGDFKAAAAEDYLKGSYPPEGDPGARAAWIGRSASATFKAPISGRTLLVSGWAPYSLHQKSGLKGPLEVLVRVNGVDVADRTFSSDAFFDIRVLNADLIKAASFAPTTTVEVATNHGFVPSQSLGGNDARELSIKISKVELVR
jgi:hypothetical protein